MICSLVWTFSLKMGTVVDVEKNVIQVCNGSRMEVEALPLIWSTCCMCWRNLRME
jgi:hypothetical protein